MVFLEISLTKDPSHLLHVIHSFFYLRIFKKTRLLFGFNIPYKKTVKQENLRLFIIV